MPVQNTFDIKVCFKTLAAGDAREFEFFFETYKKRVFGVALRLLKSEIDAEETVQEVFLSIWQSRTKLSEVLDPEAYLFTITYHTIYSQLRKISRNQHLVNSIAQRMEKQGQNTTEETMAAHESTRLIHEALGQLPAQQRTIYELNKLKGLSYQEISERMDISLHTVRNHLFVATKTIRTILKKWQVFFFFF